MGKKLKQAEGKVVTGEWFWDREKDKELFIKKIDEQAHILLVAQRRMGKTSMLKEVKRILKDRCTCLFVDLQKAKDGADAIVEISIAMQEYTPLWTKVKGVFANILEKVTEKIEKVEMGEIGVTLRAGVTAGDWAAKGDQLFEILAASERPVILLLDEVPIMVNRILKDENSVITPERQAEAAEFMSWLRHNSIKHQGKVSIVISGSIGLEPILHQARLSATINNFVPFELKAWDDGTAKGCIEALANEYKIELEDGVTQKMIERLGSNIPHHVQMFFSHIYDHCTRKGKMQCSAGDAEEIYEKEMLGTRGHAELTHYEERLEQVLDKKMLPLALDMLTEAAVVGKLSREAIAAFQREYKFEERDVAEVQKEILWVLQHDGYLEQGPDGYIFISKLLRDWWNNRHQMFFTPVLKRGE